MDNTESEKVWRSAAGSYLACTNRIVRYFGCPRHLQPLPKDPFDERSWVVIPNSRGNPGLLVDWMIIQQVADKDDRATALVPIIAYPLSIFGMLAIGAVFWPLGDLGVVAGIVSLCAGVVAFHYIVSQIVMRPLIKANVDSLRVVQIPEMFFDIVEKEEASRARAKMKISLIGKGISTVGAPIVGSLVDGVVSKGAEKFIEKGAELGLERMVERAGEKH